MKKKLLLLAILVLTVAALTAIFSISSSSATATSGNCGENLTWVFDAETGVLEISGTGAMNDYVISTPPWASNRKAIREIQIGSGVTSIGYAAFRDCTSLTSVVIDSSVERIRSYAFQNCSALADITIGDNVRYIEKFAFDSTAYYQDETNWENGVLYIDGFLIEAKTTLIGNYIIKEGTRCIADNAFKNCTEMTKITVPDSVMSIGSYAFSNCTKLVSVKLPDSITDISRNLFSDCTALSSVEIGNSVKNIFLLAFSGCSALTQIEIPSSVTHLGSSAFENCSNLVQVVLPQDSQLVSVDSEAFQNCSKLASFTVPKSLSSIGPRAFVGCSSLKDVYIQDLESWLLLERESGSENSRNEGLSQYGTVHFLDENGSEMTQIIIPNSISFVPACAFFNARNIQSVVIGNHISAIKWEAFSGCSSLTQISIGDSVSTIEFGAFYHCTSLESIRIPASVTSLSSAFEGCNAVTDLYIENLEVWLQAGAFIDLSGNRYFETVHFLDENGNEIVDLIIPEGISSLRSHAFRNAKNIQSVTIPTGITHIGEYAFKNCTGLKNIFIPVDVKGIGSDAFLNCNALETVNYAGTVEDWVGVTIGSPPLRYGAKLYISNQLVEHVEIRTAEKISKNAFYGYSSLKTLTVHEGVMTIDASAFEKCVNLNTVVLSEGVTDIGSHAFYGCTGLTEIIFPNSVTSIGVAAFCNCTSLKSAIVKSKNVTISDTKHTFPTTTIIYGHKDSTAEAYATKYKRTFILASCDQVGHSYGNWVLHTAPSESKSGVLKRVCVRDKNHVDTAEIPVLNLKNYPNGYLEVLAPTCETNGIGVYTYAKNEQIFHFEIAIPMLNHNEVKHSAKEPTCTTGGWDAYETCSRPECNYTTYHAIPQLQHTHGAEIVIEKATCTKMGLNKRVCIHCGGDEQYISTPKTGCNFELRGNEYVCRDCGDSYKVSDSGELLDNNKVIYLSDVADNFSFEVLYSGEGAMPTDALRVVDMFYLGSALEDEGTVSLATDPIEAGKYQVKPSSRYKSGHTYAVLLGEGVTFAKYSAKELQFKVESASSTEVDVDDSANVIFIKNSDVIVRKDGEGFVELLLSYVPDINAGDEVADFVFLSDASGEEELFGSGSVSLGDIVLGKVSKLWQDSADGTCNLLLVSPTEEEIASIFSKLHISGVSEKADWSAISEEEKKKIADDLSTQFDSYIHSNDDFKKYVFALGSTLVEHGKGLSVFVSESEDDGLPLFDISVDIGTNGDELYVTVTVSYTANYKKQGGGDAGFVTAALIFRNGVDIEFEPHFEKDGLRLYFDFEAILIQSTAIDFDVTYHVDPTLLGYETEDQDPAEAFKAMLISKLKDVDLSGMFEVLENDSTEGKYLSNLMKKLTGRESKEPSVTLLNIGIGTTVRTTLTLKFVYSLDISAILDLHYERVEKHTYGVRASLTNGFTFYKNYELVRTSLDFSYIGAIHTKAGIGIDTRVSVFLFLNANLYVEFGVYADYAGIGEGHMENGKLQMDRHDFRFEMGIYDYSEISVSLGIRFSLVTEKNEYPFMLYGRDRIYFDYAYEGDDASLDVSNNDPHNEDWILLEDYFLNTLYYDLSQKNGKLVASEGTLYLRSEWGEYSLEVEIVEGEEYAALSNPYYGDLRLLINENAPADFDLAVRITVIDARGNSYQYSEGSAYYRLPELMLTLHVQNHKWLKTGETPKTCGADGYVYYTCLNHQNCTKSENLGRLEHFEGEKSWYEDATCTHEERKASQCLNCKEIVYESVKGGEPKKEHYFPIGSWELLKAPTKNTVGQKKYKCHNPECTAVQIDEIPVLGYTDGLLYEACDGGWRVIGYMHADNTTIDGEATTMEVRIPSHYMGKAVVEISSFTLWGDAPQIVSFSIPATVEKIHATSLSLLRSASPNIRFILEEGNAHFHEDGGCIVETEKKLLVLGHGDSTIPYDGSVIEIGTYAFYGVTFENGLLIPFGISEIQEHAFSSCRGIGMLVIPKSVEFVANNAFRNCSDITTVVKYRATEIFGRVIPQYTYFVESGTNKVHPISNGAIYESSFYGCSEMKMIVFADSNMFESIFEIFAQWLQDQIFTFDYGGFCGTEHAKNCKGCGESHHMVSYVTRIGCWEYSIQKCVHCGKATQQRTENVLHTMLDIPPRANTCEQNGYTAHRECRDCGYTVDFKIIEVKHALTPVDAKSPTCKEAGHEAYEYCTRCDYTTYQEISAVGHDKIPMDYKSPTCEEAGHEAYEYCTRCDYTTYQEIPAVGHDFGPWNMTATVGNTGYATVQRVCRNNNSHVEEETRPAPRITGASLNISSDVSIKYSVTFPEGFTDAYVVFYFNGRSSTVRNYTVGDNGKYIFTFTGITPQCLGDYVSITAYAKVDGVLLCALKGNYSVRTYCENQLKNAASDTKLVTLISDLLTYGARSQIYMNYRTNRLVTEGLTLSPSTFATLDASYSKKALVGEKDAETYWKSVGLRYENTMAMYFRFYAEDVEGLSVRVTVNGRTRTFTEESFTAEGGGVYRIDFRGITATEFDSTVSASFVQSGSAVGQTAQYSVNTYVYLYQGSTDAALADLLRATYNYGVASEVYTAK